MTKLSKFGTTEKPSSEHLGNQFEVQDKHKWTTQEIGVDSGIPLVDDGKGQPHIIRQFEFSFNPEILRKIRDKKMPVPTNQELFNSNWREIQTTLWGDGLVANRDVEPRMIIGKRKYKIILVCEARMGTTIIERPQKLQDITNPKNA